MGFFKRNENASRSGWLNKIANPNPHGRGLLGRIADPNPDPNNGLLDKLFSGFGRRPANTPNNTPPPPPDSSGTASF